MDEIRTGSTGRNIAYGGVLGTRPVPAGVDGAPEGPATYVVYSPRSYDISQTTSTGVGETGWMKAYEEERERVRGGGTSFAGDLIDISEKQRSMEQDNEIDQRRGILIVMGRDLRHWTTLYTPGPDSSTANTLLRQIVVVKLEAISSAYLGHITTILSRRVPNLGYRSKH